MSKARDRHARRPPWVRPTLRAVLGGIGLGLGILAFFSFVGVPHVPATPGGSPEDPGVAARLAVAQVMLPNPAACHRGTPC